MNIIFERRSVRRYLDRPIDRKILVRLCEAGMMAPSARNTQPWQFLVITEKEKKRELSHMSMFSGFASEAPALIAVLLDKTKVTESHTKWQQDLSAASENILLESLNHGLGGCWLGLYPDEARIGMIREILHLPERYLPFSILTVGYPAEEKEGPEHIDHTKIHFETIG